MKCNGPWRAEGWENLIVNDKNGFTIVCAPGYGDLTDMKQTAKLISAAPELLEALVELVERAEAGSSIRGLPEYDLAIKAIDKATKA